MGGIQNKQEARLLSMTDFVLEQLQIKQSTSEFKEAVAKYVNFLKQPLELWMFVPCDEKGNVLERPECSLGKECYSPPCVKYQQAKERCLFFSQHGENEMLDPCLAKVYLDEFFNIEQLSNDIRRIKLTPTAIKQLGL